MRKHLCLWLVGSAVALLPAVARAEDEPKAYPECTKAPSEAETAAAKGAYQAGNASFDEADYPRAITYWEDAYRRDCTANLLLKNLARAYELYGQKRQAVVALETFLVREPASADKEQIQRRIEVLKRQISAEKAPVPATRAAPTPGPTVASAEVKPELPQPVPDGRASGSSRSVIPLVVAGAGAVTLVVGIAVYIPAARDVTRFEDQCPPDASGQNQCALKDVASKANSAQQKKVAGAVVMGAGAAVLAGGLIWYFVQPRHTDVSATLLKPRISPAIAHGFAGIALSGAF